MGKKRDIQQIESISRELNLNEQERREFGKFLEAEKAAGNRGTKNSRGDFTYQELTQKAREFFGLNE